VARLGPELPRPRLLLIQSEIDRYPVWTSVGLPLSM